MSSTSSSSSTSVDDDVQVILLDSSNNDIASLTSDEMTCKKIYSLFKNKKRFLTIVDCSKKHTAICWQRFGFPAVLDQNGHVVKIFDKFVSCRLCYTTYSFKSNSTSHMNKHSCNNTPSSTSTTNSQSLKQSKLVSYTTKTPQTIKLKEHENNKIKNLQAEWICADIRPFSVVNDIGLRSLIQECISLGILFYENIPLFIGLLRFYRFKIWKYFS